MLVRAMPWLGKASAMPAAVRPARHPARYLGHQPAIDEVRNRLSQDSPRTSIRSLRPEYVLLATLLATHPTHPPPPSCRGVDFPACFPATAAPQPQGAPHRNTARVLFVALNGLSPQHG